MFPQGPRRFVILIIPLFWLLRKAVAGRFFPATPYNGALLLLVGMLAVGYFVSFDPALSLPKLAGVLMGVALLAAIVDYGRRFSLWPIVAVFLLMGLVMAVVGLLGANWEPPFEFLNGARALLARPAPGIPGAVGGIVNSNELAGALGWVTPLALACCLGLGRQLWRNNRIGLALLLAITPLLGFILIATSSRGGILALVAGVSVVLALFLPSRWRLVLIVGLTITLAVIVSYAVNSLEQDLVGDALGLSGRMEIWSRALLAIADFPLTGVGLNAFRRVVHQLYPLFSVPADIDLGHAHNHILQAALDLGLPGLVSYLAIWLISAGLLYASWKNLSRRGATSHPYYALVAGLAGSLMAGWVFGIFDAIALGSRPGFLWWMLLGFSASVHYAVKYSGERLRSRRHSSLALSLPLFEKQPSPTATGEQVSH
jgi:putative inorganic carbon (HCO3(-)) transporter